MEIASPTANLSNQSDDHVLTQTDDPKTEVKTQAVASAFIRKLHGHIDTKTRYEIVGWVWDPRIPEERIRLELLEEDRRIATALADIFRPGLEAAGIGDGHHVFRITLRPEQLSADSHVLQLRCIDTLAPVPGSPIIVEASSRQETLTKPTSVAPLKKSSTDRVPLKDLLRGHIGDIANAKTIGSRNANGPTADHGPDKDAELAYAKSIAAKRNADLAAITLHLRAIEDQKLAEAVKAESLTRELSVLRAESRDLRNQVSTLRDLKDGLIFDRARSINSQVLQRSQTQRERALLIERCGPLSSVADIQALACKTGLFDVSWYTLTYSLGQLSEFEAFKHYIEEGEALGYNPSMHFDSAAYGQINADANIEGQNLLIHYLQLGLLERRPALKNSRKLKIRVIMMQKNELDLIYPWAAYHGSRFGFENLYIIDNGSDEPTRKRLEHLSAAGVTVTYTHDKREDFINKGRIVADVIQRMDDEDPADFYFPLDCDEFIGTETKGGKCSFDADDIEASLLEFRNSTAGLAISAYLNNHPTEHGHFRRSGNQRKSFFAKSACNGLDRGFNNPQTKHGGPQRRTRIIYVHYHFKPFPILQSHARQRLEAFLDDFSDEGLRQYIAERRTGFHSARHLTINEKTYLSELRKEDFRPVDQFTQAFSELGVPLPFSQT
jgi:hypothetical protein